MYIVNIIYMVAAAIGSFFLVMKELSIGLFWINILADESGRYKFTHAFGLTLITLILPLALVNIIIEIVKRRRGKSTSNAV